MKHDFNTLHLLWAIRDMPKNVVNGYEKIILFVLLSCAGSNNSSWHTQKSLCEMCSLGETSLKKYTKSLEQKKLITIERPAHYTHYSNNKYQLSVDLIMTYSKLESVSPDDPNVKSRGRAATVSGSPRDSHWGRETTTKKEREERKKEGATNGSREPSAPLTPEELAKDYYDLPNGRKQLHPGYIAFREDYFKRYPEYDPKSRH